MTEVKNRIKEIREEKGLSRKQLAKRLKISSSHLAHVENNTKTLTTALAVKVRNELKVNFKDIFLD